MTEKKFEDLKQLSSTLAIELLAINGKLRQQLTAGDLLFGLRRAIDLPPTTCVLLQPRKSGYAWSDREIPIILIVRGNTTVRVRIKRGRSYRSNACTPQMWAELRAFPQGDTKAKLVLWAKAADGDTLTVENLQSLGSQESNCRVSEWHFPFCD